ncbi:MAG: hypothetical protein GY762_05495 [Proteobacteria bacterium]|nr:hypothetical protein [Pseudomonadota bacterium]
MGDDKLPNRCADTEPVDKNGEATIKSDNVDTVVARRMFMKKTWLVGPLILAAFTVSKPVQAATCIPVLCAPGGGCRPNLCRPTITCLPDFGCWPDWQ